MSYMHSWFEGADAMQTNEELIHVHIAKCAVFKLFNTIKRRMLMELMDYLWGTCFSKRSFHYYFCIYLLVACIISMHIVRSNKEFPSV